MSKSNVLFVAVGMILATGAHAEDADQPLFTAFRSFCADTQAIPSAVKRAVEAAGGKLQHVSNGELSFPVSIMTWDVTVGGHALIVAAGAERPPLGPDKVQFSTHCQIVSLQDEAASMAPLRRWAVVPPASESSIEAIYLFRGEGPARVAVAGNTANDVDHWMMTLRRPQGQSFVQLIHFSLPEPAPQK